MKTSLSLARKWRSLFPQSTLAEIYRRGEDVGISHGVRYERFMRVNNFCLGGEAAIIKEAPLLAPIRKESLGDGRHADRWCG